MNDPVLGPLPDNLAEQDSFTTWLPCRDRQLQLCLYRGEGSDLNEPLELARALNRSLERHIELAKGIICHERLAHYNERLAQGGWPTLSTEQFQTYLQPARIGVEGNRATLCFHANKIWMDMGLCVEVADISSYRETRVFELDGILLPRMD